MKTDLKEFVLDWLEQNEGDYADDDSCFYAMAQAVNGEPKLPKTGTAELRKLYNAEKGERE